MINKGDKVVMHTCMEAQFHEGIVWDVSYDEFTRNGQHPVVFLEGFSGSFAVEYLRKVDPSEETIECIMCDTQVLADSKGYIPGTKLGSYWCKECAVEEEKQQKILKEVEQMKITHTVFKNSDLEKAAKEFSNRVKTDLEGIAVVVNHVRKDEGRSRNPRYIVINTDENPRMIEEIIKVMKRFGKWGLTS
ncbi:hypothetical protein [Lysinibacillus fusiformis]|uniref:hypothetical protein n=1 Tax=Lysinibacillus fusiformis TaxID=28031 RepID=UPI0018801D23|nr:hypothetical protein [Lysinibacillus fusiformis]MBD8521831.1 hypothetical protein [Lysinibacillus fusiformis]